MVKICFFLNYRANHVYQRRVYLMATSLSRSAHENMPIDQGRWYTNEPFLNSQNLQHLIVKHGNKCFNKKITNLKNIYIYTYLCEYLSQPCNTALQLGNTQFTRINTQYDCKIFTLPPLKHSSR